MSRFFVNPEDIAEKYIYLSDKTDLHHMKKVLRLRVGDEVDISDGEAWEYRTKIEEIGDDEAVLLIEDKQKFAREPELIVTLYQGIPKGSKMEEIIQKSVELGVHDIVPVFMERTVVVDKGNMDKKVQRWQKIADEAVKQCKRGIIPEVKKPVKFAEAVCRMDEHDLVVFPYENEDGRTIKDCLQACFEKKPKTVAVIIGPEGGFDRSELDEAVNAGCEIITLGKRILRTETAGMMLLSVLMYNMEE